MIDLRSLEAYLAVSELGTARAAARRMGCSQSSVTRMLQELERGIGHKLFLRTGQRLEPTRIGLLLVDTAARALSGVEEIRRRAERLAAERGDPLRICAVPALALGLLPAAHRAVAAMLPQGIDVESAPPGLVAASVQDQIAALGLASLPLDYQGLKLHWLGAAPCVLAGPVAHPLIRRGAPVGFSELADSDIVTIAAGAPGLRNRIETAMRAEGVDPLGAIRVNSSVGALAFIEQGAGLAVVEPITAAAPTSPGVGFAPLQTRIDYLFGAVTPEGKAIDSGLAALIDALADTSAAMLDGFMRYASEREWRLQGAGREAGPEAPR